MLNSFSYINSSFFYIDDIDILKTNKDKINGDIFVVSQFAYTFNKNYKYFEGTSYELYYIDSDKNFTQLTYTFAEGNGISINDDLCVDLNIDNESLQDNENNQLSINSNSFSTAFYNKKGILHGINELYINDIFMDKNENIGSIYSDNGFLSLNKGLVFDLNEIKYYYDECKLLNSQIDELYNIIFNKKSYFKVGDYLYKTSEGVITDEPVGNPYMVCIISSNILKDGYARFTLINRGTGKSKFGINNKEIPIKNTFCAIPVYEEEYTNISSELDKIVPSKKGYFATDREDWINNIKNKFNINEHYGFEEEVEPTILNWYLETYYVNKTELYKLEKQSIVSEAFNLQTTVEHPYFTIEANIEYKDGFKGRYTLPFEYNKTSKRYELRSDRLPDNTTDVNEYFTEASSDIDEIISTANTSANSNTGIFDDDESYIQRYNYRLVIPSGMFDLDTVYLKCYLAKDDNCQQWEEGELIPYNNSTGLVKVFSNLTQNHMHGGIKIICYSSRYQLDRNPYDMGVYKPTTWINQSTSSDNTTLYIYKTITISSSSFIKMNISKYLPISLGVRNQSTGRYMFTAKGIINSNVKTTINLSYTFDYSYWNTDNKGHYFPQGCIKIKRSDNKPFDFSQCLVSVKFFFLINNTYQEYELKIEFKINGNILESDMFRSSWPWNYLQNIQISGFDYISDAQNTKISDYDFDNKANILNKE